MLKFFDASGQELFIDRETYKRDVLPMNIKESWNDPDKLAMLLRSAVTDQIFDAYVEEAAIHLMDIDPDSQRSNVTYGILLNTSNRKLEAEDHYYKYLKNNPTDTLILCNLASAQFGMGKIDDTIKNVEKAIELNPDWKHPIEKLVSFKTKYRTNNGEDLDDAYISVLEECSKKHSSIWLQFWMAEILLKQKDLEKAFSLLEQVLKSDCLNDEILETMSQLLGSNGYMNEMISLVASRYVPGINKHQIGLNILIGYHELKRIEEGKLLISKMIKLNSPELQEILGYFENKFNL